MSRGQYQFNALCFLNSDKAIVIYIKNTNDFRIVE